MQHIAVDDVGGAKTGVKCCKKTKHVRCSRISVKGCEHGFFCEEHFDEYQKSVFNLKEITSDQYDVVVNLKSLKGKRMRQSKPQKAKIPRQVGFDSFSCPSFQTLHTCLSFLPFVTGSTRSQRFLDDVLRRCHGT